MVIGFCKYRLILELNVLLRFGPLNDFEIQIERKDKKQILTKKHYFYLLVYWSSFFFFCLNDFNMQIYIYIYIRARTHTHTQPKFFSNKDAHIFANCECLFTVIRWTSFVLLLVIIKYSLLYIFINDLQSKFLIF